MPCVFSTAIHVPINMARVENSKEWHRSGVAAVEPQANRGANTVLIHSASGGLGQAAIQIPQHVGATRCVAKYGSMLEVGKRDILGKARLSMNEFLLNRSFIGVDMAQIVKEKPSLTYRERARYLVFFSHSAGESADDQGFFKELIAQGTNVTRIKGDVSRLEDIERIRGCSPAPISGIFQLAMVLKDSFTFEMAYADRNIAVTPDIAGTWNIHRVFKDSYLNFLVLMCLIAGIRGYPSQANSAAANSFLNGFARYRHAHGLPCSVINLVVMDEVGFVARTPFVLQRFREQSTHILTIRDLINTIHLAARNQHPAGNSGSRAHNPTHLHVGFMSTHDASRPGIRDVRLSPTRRTKLHSREAHGASEGPLREFF
ncbi:KR-domain-containing protein [Aspergillus homomorphus CBS 101889]|uniref:KR-domain-containing protein n=1 Tax=Aspergillus homomorphus (strain CBS 101889) TaxID=1450537 RepID=A0A395HIE7_ASPHC|nr:KR-domain-containing protein [Aspergillus homomorphus CBS 101889]RAL06945.1 KR-domain-containing protein [Aspergillus homomorphus CBS 101889]